MRKRDVPEQPNPPGIGKVVHVLLPGYKNGFTALITGKDPSGKFAGRSRAQGSVVFDAKYITKVFGL